MVRAVRFRLSEMFYCCYHLGEDEPREKLSCDEHSTIPITQVEIREGWCRHGLETEDCGCEEELTEDEDQDDTLPIQFAVRVNVSLAVGEGYFEWDGRAEFVRRRIPLTKAVNKWGTRMFGFVNGRADFESVSSLKFSEDGHLEFA
eukprot:TRINITY_DN31192_c0_g1_i1.p2 TRINITY_DN31192_c0_g1~~TRINITY_DN31192_c0_g1_i1.p2  ORF type:complete len:146 (+),score=29.61 TRINITY_DN31192_c0_g1_i1:315-752(+)